MITPIKVQGHQTQTRQKYLLFSHGKINAISNMLRFFNLAQKTIFDGAL